MTQSSSQKYPPALYITATPIGNLGDMTYRAVETLKGVDVIFCEDTRVTRKLLNAYNIRTPMKVYNDHSGDKERTAIAGLIEGGKAVALVSDAGMPLVSDPGYKLVRFLQERGVDVTTVPGASSVLSALALSGIPSDTFYFGGFLPSKEKARTDTLAKAASIPATLIFFETATRIEKTLQAMQNIYASREVVIARELTKKFEEIRRGKPDKLLQNIAENAAAIKGEVVLVVAPPDQQSSISDYDLDEMIADALEGHSLRDAVDQVMAKTGLKRKEVYNRAVEIKDGKK